ncbi:hypothetical protein [Kitasatospora sp. NPDC093806]|uniref:hypothetical protein n=1 Tax=Kitasatospora sp. NPDC093806 TaxID=3155075 RepID=UPI0034370095
MDLRNLRVVALGHSSAGKSSYLAAMYTRLAVGRKGFRLVTEPVLGGELLATGRGLRKGVYPPPSSRRTELGFSLLHGPAIVLGFHWTDYRGGALTSSAANDPETAELLRQLTGADAVVVFVDAHRLATDPESHDEIRRSVVLLHRAVGRQDTPLPIVLAYTKSDLVPDRAAWGRARAAAAPLEELIGSGGRIRGTTVALSCGPSPKGVAVPVLWCLATLFGHQVREMEEELAATKAAIKDLRQDAHAVDSLVSWFKGVESATKRLERMEGVARTEEAELAPLRRPARRLARLLASEQRRTAPPAGAATPVAAR